MIFRRKSIKSTGCYALLIILPILLLLIFCRGLPISSGFVAETNAVKIAKEEVVKHGCRAEDYRVRVVDDTNAELWKVYFSPKAQYPPPGSGCIVTVEKSNGRTLFMPGE